MEYVLRLCHDCSLDAMQSLPLVDQQVVLREGVADARIHLFPPWPSAGCICCGRGFPYKCGMCRVTVLAPHGSFSWA